MGWRFRKSYSILPGVRVNLTSLGASYTVGPRGASLNLGPRGGHANVGIPGTGLSYRQCLDTGSQTAGVATVPNAYSPIPKDPVRHTWGSLPEPSGRTPVSSATVDTVSSEGLAEFREILHAVLQEREQLNQDIAAQAREVAYVNSELASFRKSFVVRNLRKSRIVELEQQAEQAARKLQELEDQFAECRFDMDVECDEAIRSAYEEVVSAFGEVITCSVIWDITAYEAIDQEESRSSAGLSITQKPVAFVFRNLEFVDYPGGVPAMQNANGADLYLYPGLLLLVAGGLGVGLVDLADLVVDCVAQTVQEEGSLPSDAQVMGYTWAKVNRDGSPDRRFKGNHQIPLVSYGSIRFRTSQGLNEAYLFSNANKAEAFGKALVRYTESFRRASDPLTRVPVLAADSPQDLASRMRDFSAWTSQIQEVLDGFCANSSSPEQKSDLAGRLGILEDNILQLRHRTTELLNERNTRRQPNLTEMLCSFSVTMDKLSNAIRLYREQLGL